jgi:excisionase family DNA binding protein
MAEARFVVGSSVGEPLLTIGEVAELLRVSPSSVSRLTKTGEIPCVRLNRSIRFSPAAIRNLVEGTRAGASGGAA